ncbi:MAG: carboxypeptidase-like regulatory domain-containing protein [Bacteroidetes bacterium]|nr:carboxypeptidase-like regulatory domain-containing protein [Bacteroidota bacterium]
MKTMKIFKGSWLVMGLLMLSTTVLAYTGNEDEFVDTVNFDAYYGKVVDGLSGRYLPFATVEAMGSNIATVSNIDGDFIIKIAKDSKVSELKVSYIGFRNKTVNLTQFKRDKTKNITLTPSSVQLEEVVIRPQDAMKLIHDVLKNIRENYSTEPMMMRGFYRETIQRGRNYASISEAVVDIYKGSYINDFQVDQVKLFKGRKSADVEKMDTVLFKVQGGPSTAILLDVIKNPYILLSPDYVDIYNFNLSDIIAIDDKLHYVVSFNQKEYIDEPYYNGKFYIDMQKLAISEVEFELNTENKEEAARLFIQRKPMGMRIIPEKAAYRVKYTIEDNHWFFRYARAEVKFKVSWKKKFFHTTYSTMSELAITDRTYEGIEKFSGKERFKSSDVLNDKVYIFFDLGFWGGYNVIEPDQSIESAIRRLNRKYLKRNG